MNFSRRALKRIVISSLVIGTISGFLGWKIAIEDAELESVDSAIDVSQRVIAHVNLLNATDEAMVEPAQAAADNLILGWYDIAEIYDQDGMKLASAYTSKGEQVEELLPSHRKPDYKQASYQSMKLDSGDWILRIFVPLIEQGSIRGYFEGIRLVPGWQQSSIRHYAIWVAILSGGAAWLCGLVIYPLVIFLNRENDRYMEALKVANVDMMYTLGKAIALRDSDTGAHNFRVTWYAAELAEAVAINRRAMMDLLLGSYLHDVGKIAISDTILCKPGRLTDDEMTVMKTHVLEGIQMVQGIPWLTNAKPIIGSHHEKWDGTGYPDQLAGLDIPINARIFAIVDVFDALCSKRPYKEPFSYEQAMNIIREGRGSHFDPELVDRFDAIARRLYNTVADASEETCRSLMSEKINQYFMSGFSSAARVPG